MPADCHPDVVTMAKPLANGYPIGAVLMRDSVAEVMTAGELISADSAPGVAEHGPACRYAWHDVRRFASGLCVGASCPVTGLCRAVCRPHRGDERAPVRTTVPAAEVVPRAAAAGYARDRPHPGAWVQERRSPGQGRANGAGTRCAGIDRRQGCCETRSQPECGPRGGRLGGRRAGELPRGALHRVKGPCGALSDPAAARVLWDRV